MCKGCRPWGGGGCVAAQAAPEELPDFVEDGQAEVTRASTQYASTEGGKSGRSTPKVAELESVVASDEASACAGCGQEGHVSAVLAKAAIAARGAARRSTFGVAIRGLKVLLAVSCLRQRSCGGRYCGSVVSGGAAWCAQVSAALRPVALASEHLFVCESAFWCGGSCEGSCLRQDGLCAGTSFVLGLASRQAAVDGGPQARGGVPAVRVAGRLVRVDRLSRRTASGAAVFTAFL